MNNLKQERERIRYIRQLHTDVVNRLFEDRVKKLNEAMWLIAEENQILVGASTNTFMWEKEWFPIPNPPAESNRELHSSLRPRVRNLINEMRSDPNGLRNSVHNLLGKLLFAAKHVKDLKRIVPGELLSLFPTIDSEVFNCAEPMTEDELAAFYQQNTFNTDALKRLMMTRLLLNQF